MSTVSDLQKGQARRPNPEAAPGRAALLVLLCGVQLILILDFSIVNVALPDMARGLGFDRAGVSWVLSAYALTFGGLLLLGGRLADLVGRRRMFLIGLAVFGTGSLLGGMAGDPAMLVVMRAVQGAGAALTAPAVLSLVTTTFPEGPERARALGWLSAAGASGFAVGVLTGGMVTQLAGWRAVMFVNVPLAAVAIVMGLRLIPEVERAVGPLLRVTRRRYDLLGALSGTAGSSALIFGLVQIGEAGRPVAMGVVPLALGGLFLIGFVMIESRVATPLLPLRLFRSRWLTAANGLSTLTFVTAGAMPLLLSLHLQQVIGLDPLTTGLAFLPSAFAVAVAAQVAPRLAASFGAKPVLITGIALVATGAAWMARMAPDSGYASTILPATMVFGIGLGTIVTTTTIAATTGVPAGDQGVASGLLTSSQQLGAALGVAILATLASRHTQLLGEASPDTIAAGIQIAFLAGAAIAAVSALTAVVGLPSTRARRPDIPGANQPTPSVARQFRPRRRVRKLKRSA